MEILIRVRYKFPNKEAAQVAQDMLGDDPPVFEEEVPSEYAPIFRAFEFLPEPDELKKVSNITFDALYELGRSGQDQLHEAIEELGHLDSMKVFTCCSYDEEIFLSLLNRGTMEPVYKVDKLINDIGIEVDHYDDMKWANKLFAHIEKLYFEKTKVNS